MLSSVGAPALPRAVDPAGLWLRCFARALDLLLLLVPAGGAGAIAAASFDSSFAGQWAATTVCALVAFGYSTVWEATGRLPIGMAATGIEVSTITGGRPSILQTSKRNAYLLLMAVPAIGPALLIVSVVVLATSVRANAQRRGLHDRWAGMVLERT